MSNPCVLLLATPIGTDPGERFAYDVCMVRQVRGTLVEAEIIEETARGRSLTQIAEAHDVGTATVSRVRRANRALIEQRIEALRLLAVEHSERHLGEILDKLAATAKDPTNRAQPQAGRVYGEFAGLIGGKGVNVHIGDSYSQSVSVNLGGEGSEHDPALEAELRRKLGLD